MFKKINKFYLSLSEDRLFGSSLICLIFISLIMMFLAYSYREIMTLIFNILYLMFFIYVVALFLLLRGMGTPSYLIKKYALAGSELINVSDEYLTIQHNGSRYHLEKYGNHRLIKIQNIKNGLTEDLGAYDKISIDGKEFLCRKSDSFTIEV